MFFWRAIGAVRDVERADRVLTGCGQCPHCGKPFCENREASQAFAAR